MVDATWTLPLPDPAPDRRPSLRVTIASGPQQGRSYRCDRPLVLVGRSPSADVPIEDPAVSLFHLELSARGQGILVRDRHSKNGVRTGLLRIEQALVPSGCPLLIGATTLCVELDRAFTMPRSSASSFGELVGASRAMQELYAVLERLAGKDIGVFIHGETGTGKELVARALHQAGPRARRPLVVLDCTSIPATLAESALFGHSRGAFTGASEARKGAFEAAHGGVLFIDEIGELPLAQQPLLLRALQERQVTRVGEHTPVPVDVQVIAATWRDLEAMVNQGRFREDLYYRLVQAPLRLPSLAERPEDIPLLIDHFLRRLPARVRARAMSAAVREALCARSYPGNVRELKSLVERLAVLAEGAEIGEADLAFAQGLAGARGAARGLERPEELAPFKEAKQTCLEAFERGYLQRLMERSGGRIARAARLAGLERHSLRDLLRRHGLYEGR